MLLKLLFDMLWRFDYATDVNAIKNILMSNNLTLHELQIVNKFDLNVKCSQKCAAHAVKL
jgi:hypothetical protein